MTSILSYILLGLMTIALLSCLAQLFRVKVWLQTKSKRGARLTKIGFLDYKGRQEVPEAHLIGRSKSPAIGRVKMGDNDDNAYVEVLITDGNDDSIKPKYRTCGYVTQEGYIYRQIGNKKPQKVGYTAKPSNPNKPSAEGERTWKSLWLKCTLHTYEGQPMEEIQPMEETQPMEEGKPKEKVKPTKKGKPKNPVAISYYNSFHSSKKDPMPPETRAAAFSYFFGKYNKNDYHEYYNSPAYGWKDTALLASFIYAILYVVWYIVLVKVLADKFIGLESWQAIPLYGMYVALWAIVRAIKIECIENSNTIQPKLDLFNKALGQNTFDIAILLCCIITLAFTGTYYQFDFVALALAIATGVFVNMILRSSSSRWEIKNPFATEEESEDDEENDIPIPEGDILRTYKWTLDSDNAKNVIGEINLYFNSQYIVDLRYTNPFYSQRKDKPTKAMVLSMFHYMKEHRGITARVRYTAFRINQIATQLGLSIEDTLQFTLDFVQEPNIRFCMNRDSKIINQYEDYIRFPDEVLYDLEADSNSKSLLAAMLFHYLGHNILYLISRVQHHGAIGIEVKDEWVKDELIFGKKIEEVSIIYNGKKYIFCETTSDGFRIGGTMEGMRHEDFDEQIELPLIESDVDDSNEDTVTCIYSWDLDSESGNKLHGSYTLEFSKTEIEDLRQINPFKTYTEHNNQNSYEDNIKTIFNYLREDSERTNKVREIAKYIKKTIEDAKLCDLDLVQFALDFCQAPNITYCVDEESKGINYAKEYMRFPDEVLFDKEGDCDCKSSLTAALFHELGYNVIVMLSQKLQHAAIGIEGKEEWLNAIKPENPESIVREYNNKKYLYCETTGDGYRIGHIKDNESIQDFETIIEI